MTKTVTPEPRDGNPPVRIAETEHGMLNSIGLANPGRERFLAETLPALRALGVPLWVSVGGFSAREYAETCARLDGRRRSSSTSRARTSTRRPSRRPRSSPRCRAATDLPLYAKLSPAAWDIAEVARAVEAAGADGLSLVNTIRGLALDRAPAADRSRAATGGYSGPALKPIALAAVYACRRVDRAADRRHGRRPDGPRRARAGRLRRDPRRARDGPLRRPGRAVRGCARSSPRRVAEAGFDAVEDAVRQPLTKPLVMA